MFLGVAGYASPLRRTKHDSLVALELIVNWEKWGWDLSAIAAAATEDGGGTMLHEAVTHGHTEALEALVAAGASLEARMDEYSTAGVRFTLTPLHMAAAKGKVEPIRALIAAGANLEAISSHYELTPLHMAARRGHASAISALTAAGASLSARNIEKSSPPLCMVCHLWSRPPPPAL